MKRLDKSDPDFLLPSDGGCWFCYKRPTEGDDMVFDTEFDTNVHKSCIRERLTALGDSDEPSEARLMSYLLIPDNEIMAVPPEEIAKAKARLHGTPDSTGTVTGRIVLGVPDGALLKEFNITTAQTVGVGNTIAVARIANFFTDVLVTHIHSVTPVDVGVSTPQMEIRFTGYELPKEG